MTDKYWEFKPNLKADQGTNIVTRESYAILSKKDKRINVLKLIKLEAINAYQYLSFLIKTIFK